MDKNNKKLNKDFGILICGHGSRNKLAISEFEELTKSIKERFIDIKVEYGFLEFAKPSIADGLEKLRLNSIKKIIAIPAMLFAAGHVKNDIPSVLMKYASLHQIEVFYGRELGINNSMINAACERVREVFSNHKNLKTSESMLVVVGRGSSDPDANSNVSKITRMMVEGLGLGWGETVFSGVTFPLVEPGLNHIVKLGYKNIIVFPYFLFSGVLVNRIKRQKDEVAFNNPEVSFFDAKYLSTHPYVVNTFVERINEVLNDDLKNLMNCSLCKYRSNLIGFENEVGLTQNSHHDQVEGIGLTCELCDAECNGACEIEIIASREEQSDLFLSNHVHEEINNHSHVHDSNHRHEKYPNSEHPLGPVTLKSPKYETLRKSVEIE